MVERLLCKQEVRSSILLGSTKSPSEVQNPRKSGGFLFLTILVLVVKAPIVVNPFVKVVSAESAEQRAEHAAAWPASAFANPTAPAARTGAASHRGAAAQPAAGAVLIDPLTRAGTVTIA